MAPKRFRETEKEAADDNECSVVAACRWMELEEHLKTEILRWLPVKDVYKNRCVCKHWNALLSSENFMDRIWPEAAINKQPWLVLGEFVDDTRPCMAFCFYTRTWEACFSFSFLEMEEYQQKSFGIIWRGSAAGLILVEWSSGIYLNDDEPTVSSTAFCNPYTRTSFQLPAMSKITAGFNKCMVYDDNEYKVVALGECREDGEVSVCVETYDRSQGGWNVAGFLPTGFIWTTSSWMFFCNGSFYCLAKTEREMVWGIATFSLPSNANGSTDSGGRPMLIPTLFAPFPATQKENPMLFSPFSPTRKENPQLLNCGSRILVVSNIATPPDDFLHEEIILWEFENGCPLTSSSWKWKEIARMPRDLYMRFIFRSNFQCFNCIGVGDYVCFKRSEIWTGEEINVVVYNLNKHSWICLPPCSLGNRTLLTLLNIAFQPTARMMDVH